MDKIRKFETGATRDLDDTKNHYEGYLSPLVIVAFGNYMTRHRKQADGSLRAPDNWQRGIPLESYVDSMLRHAVAVWLHHRGYGSTANESLDDALAGVFFNTQGFWHETLKSRLAQTPPTPAEMCCLGDDIEPVGLG